MTDDTHIVIVGGGWAGLSCAVELTRLGRRVTLLESARQLGGRARRVAFGQHTVDNGQHILLGAYENTLRVLQTVGVNLETDLLRMPLQLHLQGRQRSQFQLAVPKIPAPLHLLVGLVRARGLTIAERWAALRFGIRLCRNRSMLDEDLTVLDLLQRHHQNSQLIQYLWEPLCLAALNTPIATASAEVFMHVLRSAFCQHRHGSDLLLPKKDLSALLPDHAYDYIEQQGGHIQLGQRVESLLVNRRRIQAVRGNAVSLDVTHLVLAVPPYALLPLLKPIPALRDIAYHLAAFTYEPICTVYVQYPAEVSTDFPMQGFVGTLMQWVIDRQISSQPGLMAVVISGPGPHLDLNHQQLADHVVTELTAAFPHWPKPDATFVICEKRATFSCRRNINAIRPDNVTPVQGLWLAGDYTATGYPATIEGAVQSGLRCARLIEAESTQVKPAV